MEKVLSNQPAGKLQSSSWGVKGEGKIVTQLRPQFPHVHFTNSLLLFFIICERKEVLDADTDTYSILTVYVFFALVPTPPAVPAARLNVTSGLMRMMVKEKRGKATPER